MTTFLNNEAMKPSQKNWITVMRLFLLCFSETQRRGSKIKEKLPFKQVPY